MTHTGICHQSKFSSSSAYTINMTDCDCFHKNCRRQFAVVKTDELLCAGSPPSPPIIFTEPPSSPASEIDVHVEMSLLEGGAAQPDFNDNQSESPENVSTQSGLIVDESTQLQFQSQSILEPETIIHEGQEIYRVEYEIGDDDGGISLQLAGDREVGNNAAAPEVITIDDVPEVIVIDDEPGDTATSPARKRRMTTDGDLPSPSKKNCCESCRPDTPRPNCGYSRADEKALEMHQNKLLSDSLAEAIATYRASVELLLYKIRRINFNSEAPKDMISSLRILRTLNALYRTANFELDNLQQDEALVGFFAA